MLFHQHIILYSFLDNEVIIKSQGKGSHYSIFSKNKTKKMHKYDGSIDVSFLFLDYYYITQFNVSNIFNCKIVSNDNFDKHCIHLQYLYFLINIIYRF